MSPNLKDSIIPNEQNDYLPTLLRRGALLGMLGLVLLSFLASNVYALLWQRSEWLIGAVLPAVVIDLTNTERADEVLPPLIRNPILDEAATLKAEHMANNGYFAHYSPSGQSPWYWFNQVGYGFVHAGENLAVHFSDSGEVVDAWMQSPTHRANIVNGNYREIGVGTARGTYEGFDTVFVVQLFGTPAAPKVAAVTPTETLPTIAVRPESTFVDTVPVAETEFDTVVAIAEDTADTTTVPETVAGAEIDMVPMPIDESRAIAPDADMVALPATEIIDSVVTPELASLYSGHAATSTDAEPLPASLAITPTDTGMLAWWQAPAVQPHMMLQIMYVILGTLVALALLLAVIIEWRRQHPQQVLYGVGLLLVMSGLFYIQSIVIAGVRIL